MIQHTLLKFSDDIGVVVPDSLDTITTYVLQEQGDWFEEEIKFVRILLKPGQQAIDIGANYGLFTLSMAKIVGPNGRVWAFEPASSTAALLVQSVAANAFEQVVVDRRALSEHPGVAQLSIHQNSELNELVRGEAAVGQAETVTLTSLDAAAAEYGWSDIAFMKIDAEGEEAAIIRGGKKFFQTHSPLIQFEVKAGASVNLELVQAFADIGFASYRLIPGIGALAPFDRHETLDPYLLNLFCCKPDRAAQLAAEGRLVRLDGQRALASSGPVEDVLQGRPGASPYSWQRSLSRWPYAQALSRNWLLTVAGGQRVQVERALALHALAHDPTLPIAERYLGLRLCLEIMMAVCNAQPEFLRLCTLARAAREFGAREVANLALNNLFQTIVERQQVNPNEPFLSTSQRYEGLDPGKTLDKWLVGSILEEVERNSSFSSFYSSDPAATQQRLESILSFGFASPEMARRLALVGKKFFGARRA
jgi:FkbM family methyltransferase